MQAVLRAGGLTRDVLACGVHPPFDTETAQRLIRDASPSRRCVTTVPQARGHGTACQAAGWPIETYWQRIIPPSSWRSTRWRS